MAYKIKIWKDRVTDFPNRRSLTSVETQEINIVDVAREEGVTGEEGSKFSAEEMNGLEERIKLGFEETEEGLSAQDKSMKAYVDGQDVAIKKSIKNLADSVPIVQNVFTLTVAGWVTYNESGKTLYRQQVTGIVAKATDRFDCTCSAYYESILYASLIPTNSNGTLFVTTAIKPTANIVIQTFITPTRVS